MTRSVFHHFICFAAGLGLTGLLLWTPSRPKPGAEPAFTAPRDSVEPATSAPARLVIRDETPALSAEASPHERASARIAAALETIRHCGEQERAARWALVLAQLKEEGDAGITALAGFLATGEDLPLGPRLETAGIRLAGPTTLRMAAVELLGSSQNPAARELRRKETLRSLQMTDNLSDAFDYIRILEREDRGNHRDAAIAAVLRTAENPGRHADRNARKDQLVTIGEVLTHFRAVELLPVAETLARQQPEKRLDDFFGILWKVPAENRREITDRLLANASLHLGVDGAALLPKLDFQLPAARDYAFAWFNSRPSAAATATALERLGSDRHWTAGFSYPGDSWKPDASAGTPGTPLQAEARLAFLKAIDPLLSEPLVREKLAQARKSLEEHLAGTR